MKILFVTPYYYPNVGGAQNYVKSIAEGLNKKYNCDIVIITTTNKNKLILEDISGLKVYRLPYWLKISNTPVNPFWFFYFSKIIKKENPDIINFHSPVPFMADIAALATHKSILILTYHSGSMSKGKFTKDIIINIYEKFLLPHILNKVNKIICTSDFIRNDFLKSYMLKSTTITPGVDTLIFKPFYCNNKNVLFIGSLEKNTDYKGLEYLLYAIKICQKKINDIRLIIVGDGNNLNRYTQISEKLGITKSVTFKGELHNKNLANQIQHCSVLVLPSSIESFGMVLIEAMACKKPVIGTNIGGIPFVIDNNKNGLLVKPKNSKVLANAITKLLSNKNLSKELGEKGYQKVINNFTWINQIDKTYNLFKSIC